MISQVRHFSFLIILLLPLNIIAANCPVNFENALEIVAKNAGLTLDEIQVFKRSLTPEKVLELKNSLLNRGYTGLRRKSRDSLPPVSTKEAQKHREFLARETKRSEKASRVRDFINASDEILNPWNKNYPLKIIFEERKKILAFKGQQFNGFNFNDLLKEYDRITFSRATDRLFEISKIPDGKEVSILVKGKKGMQNKPRREYELGKLLETIDEAGIDRRNLFRSNIRRPLIRRNLPTKAREFAQEILTTTGNKTINVRSKEEAQMILESVLRKDQEFINTTIRTSDRKLILGGAEKTKTFHWDDTFEEIPDEILKKSGIKLNPNERAMQLVGHPPKNSHAMHPHLQIELSESRIIHIQWPRTPEQSKNFFIINESGKVQKGYEPIRKFDW